MQETEKCACGDKASPLEEEDEDDHHHDGPALPVLAFNTETARMFIFELLLRLLSFITKL